MMVKQDGGEFGGNHGERGGRSFGPWYWGWE